MKKTPASADPEGWKASTLTRWQKRLEQAEAARKGPAREQKEEKYAMNKWAAKKSVCLWLQATLFTSSCMLFAGLELELPGSGRPRISTHA